MTFVPELLAFENGAPVTDLDKWALRREELKRLICEEEFGYMPKKPDSVAGKVISIVTDRFVTETVELSFDAELGRFSFPMTFSYPLGAKKCPVIIHIGGAAPLLLCEEGFAGAGFSVGDITADNDDFTDKLAGLYTRKDCFAPGKLALWVFAACRVIDYLETRDEVDAANIGVCGHSRLGKATLYAGAMDERVKFTLANNAGCGGDALEQTKHRDAETVPYMNDRFGYWFCDNHRKYSEIPLWDKIDQHFLVGAIAPRFVAIGSADLDKWADPYSQQLTAVAASPAWALYGLPGFIGPASPAKVGETFMEGSVSYHLRDGGHALSEYDWRMYVAFMKQHL